MYLRITERRNRDGSTVAYYALAESVWNADAKRPEARVVHNFGRADQVERAALQRLVNSINRVLDAGESLARNTQDIPEIDIERVFELGVVLAARALWEELGIGEAIRDCTARAALTAPHEIATEPGKRGRVDAHPYLITGAASPVAPCVPGTARERTSGPAREGDQKREELESLRIRALSWSQGGSNP